MTPARRFASVAIVEGALLHHDRVFTYAIPEGLDVAVGSLVRAPVRGRRTLGVVVDLLERSDVPKPVPLAALVGPGLPPELVEIATWTARRYLSTLGEALASVTPERVASLERQRRALPASTPALPPVVLGGMRNGPALLRALREQTAGRFLLRPRWDADRGALIASMAATVSERGRGVVVVMPDVGAHSEVADTLARMFGDAVAWLGSDRAPRDRYADWLALRRGSKRLAAGGRAAVFAPVQDLSLVIVDDEAHHSYKEGRAPRFHARAVAAERARAAGATLVLLGVPPSGESLAAVEGGSVVSVAPSRQAERQGRPPVVVVDRAREETTHTPTSATLRYAEQALSAGDRVVVLAHRGGDELGAIAMRTARTLKRTVARLDASTPAAEVQRAAMRAPVVVATPVIAKDIALPGVGLLAIVDADAALSQPGFRAPEETFGTWWRLARWAARGRVVIETGEATHPGVRALTRWDPDVLWRADAARRRELGYPPFAALARIDVPAERAAGVAEEVRAAGLEALGPLERDAGASVVVARAGRRADLLERLAEPVARWRAAGEAIRVDVDPWEVLVPRWRS